MSKMHAGVAAENISVAYGKVTAIIDVSLDVQAGDFVMILGPNGAGKSTLLKALAGVVSPSKGRVMLKGHDVTRIPAYRRVAQGISLVPEGRGRLPGISVEDNLDLGWHAAGPAVRGNRDEEVARALTLFPELKTRLKQDCNTLSGGEMQMLAISRALLAKPDILLLDEPSLGLAPLATQRVYDALAQLARQGLTMIIAEQKVTPSAGTNETTMVMKAGRIVERFNERPTSEQLSDIYFGGAAA
jgi:branched-chain amino acid transport system ATP-binding protein